MDLRLAFFFFSAPNFEEHQKYGTNKRVWTDSMNQIERRFYTRASLQLLHALLSSFFATVYTYVCPSMRFFIVGFCGSSWHSFSKPFEMIFLLECYSWCKLCYYFWSRFVVYQLLSSSKLCASVVAKAKNNLMSTWAKVQTHDFIKALCRAVHTYK